jgi:hypothetical protein
VANKSNLLKYVNKNGAPLLIIDHDIIRQNFKKILNNKIKKIKILVFQLFQGDYILRSFQEHP